MQRPWLQFYDSHVPPHIEYPDILLQQFLDDAADKYPDRIGVFFFGGKVNFAELRAMANGFAHALREIGLERGDRLGLLLPNMPQTIVSAFGALKGGVTVFFFDPLADEEELKRQMNETGIETLVVLDLLLRRVDPIFSKTQLKKFIIAGVEDFLPFPRNWFFSLAAKGRGIHVKVARKSNIFPFREFLRKGGRDSPGLGQPGKPDEPAVVQFTKGKGGRPKPALLTHRNLVANVLQVSAWRGAVEKGRETILAIVPFHEAYGMTLSLNLPLYLAASSVHLPRFEPVQFLNALKSRRPTVFPAHPSMIEALAWNSELARFKARSLHTCYSMGPPLSEEVLQSFEKKTGTKVIEGYGLTEASPLTHANPYGGIRKPGSIGIPLPDTDARIVDPAGEEKEMPPGETGELIIRGPQVMKGYWNRVGETEKTLRGGWLHTGDLARMDEDGFFYVTGKVKM